MNKRKNIKEEESKRKNVHKKKLKRKNNKKEGKQKKKIIFNYRKGRKSLIKKINGEEKT